MSSKSNNGVLYNLYRARVGKPTTHDEVRGYWVFLTGIVLGTLGILLFVPSTSAVGTSGMTLREVSIFLAAVGLAMFAAGPVIRLPLQPWANYAAYIGQAVCSLAAVWFVLVFPADWSVQTGNQPVILLYALGLAIITVGGLVAPLLVGVTREDLETSESRVAALEADLASVREARDQLADELERTRSETETTRTDLAASESGVAALESDLVGVREARDRLEVDAAELVDVEAELEELTFPATGTAVVAAVGDRKVESAEGSYSIAELVPETDQETFDSPAAVRVQVQRPTVAAAMKRVVEASETLRSTEFGSTQRKAYEKTFEELKSIDAADDDEGVKVIGDWIVEQIHDKEKLPTSRAVRREAARFCRANGYQIRNDEWLGI